MASIHADAKLVGKEVNSNPTPSKASEPESPLSPYILPLHAAFYFCVASRLFAVLYAPILDCDETFNYWEPLHYLVHGYGLQTWEYSPEYSIRSWTYILLHAIPNTIFSFLSKFKSFSYLDKFKCLELFFVRAVLGTFCAATETRLYSVLSRNLHPIIAIFYLAIVAFSPGFFFSTTAFLPSSFAMYTSNLGLAAFLETRNGPRTAQGITALAVGTLLGWPFAGALIVPIAAGDWFHALNAGQTVRTLRQYLKGFLQAITVLALQVAIDSAFYRKLVIVPWRIVSYNVFNGGDRGPDIFGTEPWDFYVRNLLLNFNVWFVLALLAVPMLLLHFIFVRTAIMKRSTSRIFFFTLPFYLWFAIFTLQPHKEERFMFPAYPFLALNAAISLHFAINWVGRASPKTLIGKIPTRIKQAVILSTVLVFINIGMLRIVATCIAYRAPFQVYAQFQSQTVGPNDTICVGKEWYRFPSSYFLPKGVRAKFVKSEFDGLLPGEFDESRGSLYSPFPGTWKIPLGMNDRNEEDPKKHTELAQCTYLVDSKLPSWSPSSLEPNYVDSESWERLYCVPFLDSSATSLIARTIWIPQWFFVPARLQRVWGEYCLLRQHKA